LYAVALGLSTLIGTLQQWHGGKRHPSGLLSVLQLRISLAIWFSF
jgi:hypothetical protein